MEPAQKENSKSGDRQIARRPDDKDCSAHRCARQFEFVLCSCRCQRHDITNFDTLTASVTCLAFIGDKAFDANWLPAFGWRGTEAVIPLREGTTRQAKHDPEKYKWRHFVENFFCAIKAFRRIATRYERLIPASPR
jgi:hypothetical protein